MGMHHWNKRVQGITLNLEIDIRLINKLDYFIMIKTKLSPTSSSADLDQQLIIFYWGNDLILIGARIHYFQ